MGRRMLIPRRMKAVPLSAFFMDFDIEPQGMRSTVKISSRKYLEDSFLMLQCFENFLEYGLAAEVYNWQRDGSRIFYSLNTSGEKKGKVIST